MPTILIVDDDEIAARFVKRQLTREGFQVETATDGPSGVAKAESVKPDLILMDMCMPDMNDGLDATRQIRTIPALAKIPVLALTARAFLVEKQAAFEAGCNEVIEKPIEDMPAFVEKIRKWLTEVRS